MPTTSDRPADVAPGRRARRLATVPQALAALRRGLPVIVVDDEDRENEGDVVMAAVHASPAWVGWAVRHTSGVLCAPMPARLADALELPPMTARNEDPRGTAYTVSVDARAGVGTGISARDRARTLRLLADPAATAGDLVRPGHVFPLRAVDGGVQERPGHTEAAVDLCRLAGLPPVGVIAEVVGDDGELTRLPGLLDLAAAHRLVVLAIADLVAWTAPGRGAGDREQAALPRVERVSTTRLPLAPGTVTAYGYRDLLTGAEHLALLADPPAVEQRAGGQRAGGQPAGDQPSRRPLVRVHSECLTGDALGSLRCDCGPQLGAALERVVAEGGALVYLRGHEGRGIGLLAKLAAYELQDAGMDTVEANLAQGLPVDAREYGAAAAILADLGVDDVRLLTNNPAKAAGLTAHGTRVPETVPLVVGAGPYNVAYLGTKRDRMGHVLPATENGSSHQDEPGSVA